MDIAISYGTYYQYLKPKSSFIDTLNIEPDIQIFADGEIAVKFPDSIRGKRVFIFGDTVHHQEELWMTINAARRSSAGEINVVLPYYGYCRQDKRGSARGSMGAEVMATILEALKVDRIICIDLHAEQIQLAFRNAAVEHLSGKHIFIEQIQDVIDRNPNEEIVLASPDAGGTVRVKDLAKIFNLSYVIIDKERKKANEVSSMTLLGDVQGKIVLLRDDICDTGGTLIKAVNYLFEKGAKDVLVLITHPVFSNDAIQKLRDNNIKMIVANTRNTVAGDIGDNFCVIDIHDMMLKAIMNISQNKSVSSLL